MTVKYNIYLSKLNTTPDNWDTANEADSTHANGWVKFICKKVVDKAVQKNKVIHTSSHTKIRIVTGKFVQSIQLQGCLIRNTGATTGSNYWNAVKYFLLSHMALGVGTSFSFPLYLHIAYSKTGSGAYSQWMDASESMQNYLVVSVKSYNMVLDHSGVWRGNIELEEAA